MMRLRMSGNRMNPSTGYYINCTTKGGIKGISWGLAFTHLAFPQFAGIRKGSEAML